jgi:hypothetical protein
MCSIYRLIGWCIVDKHWLNDAHHKWVLHLALFYQPIDLWLAFYITMDDVTERPPTA